MPLLSVVVPVYKVENTLPRCLDSILAQTNGDFEAVVVNDGSPDRSGRIAMDYARQDARVRVFHQDNAGVSAARNRGLEEARGDFVLFCDSDDAMLPEYFSGLLAPMADGVDLVMTGFENIVSGGGAVISRIHTPSFVGRRDSLEMLRMLYDSTSDHRYVTPMPFGKLFRREIVMTNNIRFPPGMHPIEDLCFNLQYAGFARDMAASAATDYLYYTDVSPDTVQVSQKYNPREIDSFLAACRLFQEAFRRKAGDAELALRNRTCAGLLISAVVRFCRRDATLPAAAIRRRLAALVNDPEFRGYLRDYRPAPGQSRLLPLLMRMRLPYLLHREARHRADLRYGKAYRYVLGGGK